MNSQQIQNNWTFNESVVRTVFDANTMHKIGLLPFTVWLMADKSQVATSIPVSPGSFQLSAQDCLSLVFAADGSTQWKKLIHIYCASCRSAPSRWSEVNWCGTKKLSLFVWVTGAELDLWSLVIGHFLWSIGWKSSHTQLLWWSLPILESHHVIRSVFQIKSVILEELNFLGFVDFVLRIKSGQKRMHVGEKCCHRPRSVTSFVWTEDLLVGILRVNQGSMENMFAIWTIWTIKWTHCWGAGENLRKSHLGSQLTTAWFSPPAAFPAIHFGFSLSHAVFATVLGCFIDTVTVSIHIVEFCIRPMSVHYKCSMISFLKVVFTAPHLPAA